MLATRTINGDEQYTPWVAVPVGKFNVSISGTFSGTIAVQRTFDNPAGGSPTVLTVKNYTAVAEEVGDEPEQFNTVWYRIGSTAWSSGSAVVRLSR